MKKYVLLFQILLYIVATEVGAIQKFMEVPTYTEIDPGEDALLKCKISDKKGICSWQKDNKPVGMYRGKYEWATARRPMSGDCSLLIRAVKLEIDDGLWQCQVTASNFDMQDALSSPPAALAVRVAPQPPRIIFNGSRVLPDQKIMLAAGARVEVVCEVRYANPPANIEWCLESGRLIGWSQTNTSETDRPRVWASRSTLELGATRSTHGKQLVCQAHHPSYPAPYYRNAYATLDVTFIPVVSVDGSDANKISNLEEGLNSVSLSCTADGNPKPQVWWTKNGKHIVSNASKLIIAPVTRNHSGIYACQAKNAVGQSDPVKVEIDVKYAPRIISVSPKLSIDANLYSQVTLECKANGNPPPSYHWCHCLKPDINTVSKKYRCVDGYVISSTSQLQLFNVTYNHRGQYFCVAKNYIGFMERTHQSEPITLNVFGPPEGEAVELAHGWGGDDANIQIAVCANPPPTSAYWERGSLRMDVPSVSGRRTALEKDTAEGCYVYTLTIERVRSSDTGEYRLRVENDRGFSNHVVIFIVHEIMYVAPLIAAALVLTTFFVMLMVFAMHFRNRRDTAKNRPRKCISAQKRIPRIAIFSHEPRAYCIEMLNLKGEMIGINCPTDLPNTLPPESMVWRATTV